MKVKAVRIHGKKDIRLDDFEFPALRDDQILCSVISNSICMSDHKAAVQGPDHKRVPDNVAENPTLLGHEFCGEILEVGAKWKQTYSPGMKYSIQPALGVEGSLDAPGYSFPTVGGHATLNIMVNDVMRQGCLLPYRGPGYFPASLSEPMSCIVGAFHASFHTTLGSYIHEMGIRMGGTLAILAGAGPMGLGAIDYAIHCDRKPRMIVVTDIDKAKLERAEAIHSVEEARKMGVRLIYANTSIMSDPVQQLIAYTDGSGFDDVFVFAPVKPVIELGDRLLARDGCLNFFAGPTRTDFKAEMNFYNVHYGATHLIGTSGGNTDDMKESLEMMAQGRVNPATMITHVGGLTSVVQATLDLPNIPGGKKLIYTHLDMELTALVDFRKKGEKDPLFAHLAEMVENNNGLWSVKAEEYLLAKGKRLG